MKTKRCLAFMLPAAGLILAAGCDKLTRNHFDMIQLGVHDRYDVEKHIGDADDQLADLWSYERVDKHLNVFIHFAEAGKVARKEWHDTGNDVHYDSAEPSDDSSSYESTTIRKID